MLGRIEKILVSACLLGERVRFNAKSAAADEALRALDSSHVADISPGT